MPGQEDLKADLLSLEPKGFLQKDFVISSPNLM